MSMFEGSLAGGATRRPAGVKITQMGIDRPMRVTLVSTYLPRRCGLATFTKDLRDALRGAAPAWEIDVCAVDRDGLAYGPEVMTVVRHDDPGSYRRAAEAIAARGTDLVMIQHEYGIFGGPDGAHILEFSEALRGHGVPYTVTLHTVLSKPGPGQAATLAELCHGAARVTVFTETARPLAAETGLVDPARVTVVPHGAPAALRDAADRDAVGPSVRAALDAVNDSRVLATFGLIGPGKGLEHAIAALPKVVASHPDTRYLIAGSTHPEVARQDGESYRQHLADLAEQLGVAEHVLFIDAFLSENELGVLLERTHLFLTPYRSPDQICSGALTFALAAGCPVVSTDYRYARDMLAAGVDGDAPGVLVPCGDVDALAGAVTALFADDRARERARAAADALGATLTWPSVGARFAEVAAAAAATTSQPTADPITALTSVPALRLDHLDRLTDEIGIIQFGRADRPDPGSGYCVDDVARLAIVAAGLARLPLSDPRPARWLAAAVRFLEAAGAGSAGMHNLMGYDGVWRDEPHLGDHVGRAIWGLGTVVASPAAEPVRARARRALGGLLPAVGQLEFPRSVAYTLLGLSRVDDPDPEVRAALKAGVALLGAAGKEHQPWYEPVLTYDNARLPEALFAAATRLGDAEMAGLALSTLDWYLAEVGLDRGGVLHCVGNRWRVPGAPKAEADEGDEQPLDAAAVVEAAVGVWRATGRWSYGLLARRAYAWFLGANRAGTPLYDGKTGGCHDGLTATSVNGNEGAESTLAYYQAMLAIVHSGLAPAPAVAGQALRRAVRPAMAARVVR
jgi:glycosyltransferase involved in cell wall biosynthesis